MKRILTGLLFGIILFLPSIAFAEENSLFLHPSNNGFLINKGTEFCFDVDIKINNAFLTIYNDDNLYLEYDPEIIEFKYYDSYFDNEISGFCLKLTEETTGTEITAYYSTDEGTTRLAEASVYIASQNNGDPVATMNNMLNYYFDNDSFTANISTYFLDNENDFTIKNQLIVEYQEYLKNKIGYDNFSFYSPLNPFSALANYTLDYRYNEDYTNMNIYVRSYNYDNGTNYYSTDYITNTITFKDSDTKISNYMDNLKDEVILKKWNYTSPNYTEEDLRNLLVSKLGGTSYKTIQSNSIFSLWDNMIITGTEVGDVYVEILYIDMKSNKVEIEANLHINDVLYKKISYSIVNTIAIPSNEDLDDDDDIYSLYDNIGTYFESNYGVSLVSLHRDEYDNRTWYGFITTESSDNYFNSDYYAEIKADIVFKLTEYETYTMNVFDTMSTDIVDNYYLSSNILTISNNTITANKPGVTYLFYYDKDFDEIKIKRYNIISSDSALNIPKITTLSNYETIVLKWEDIYSNNAKFEIQECTSTDAKTCKTITDKYAGSNSFIDYGLDSGITYYYRVRAFSNFSEDPNGDYSWSEYSDIISVTTKLFKTTITIKESKYNYNKITWEYVNGADGYQVYKSKSKTGTYTKVKTTTGESFIDKYVAVGTTYYYKVRAYKYVNGVLKYASFSSIKSVKTTLDKTENIYATTQLYNKIKVTYNEVDGADGYAIYRTSEDDKNAKRVLLGRTTRLYYVDTTMNYDEWYYYDVIPYKIVNKVRKYGAFPSYQNDTPIDGRAKNGKITFTARSDSYNTVTLKINKVDEAVKYYIYRATSKTGTYSLVKTIRDVSLDNESEYFEWTDTKKYYNKVYYYKVKAYSPHLDYTPLTSYKAVRTKLATPTELNIYFSSTNEVTIKYNSVAYAQGYEIYRATSLKGTYYLLKRTTSLSYINKLTSSQLSNTYYYKIRAYRVVNNVRVYSYYTVATQPIMEL